MLLTYMLLGGFAGVLAGLLGVGGGLIIVPVLAGIFASQNFPAQSLMQIAIGSSLATIMVTSLSSLRAHHQRGGVRWPLMLQLTVGIIFGAWLGAAVAHLMPSDALATLFGVFELLVAAQLWFGTSSAAHQQLPARSRNLAAGGVIGAVSAILGIGGGTLTVPYLTWHNVPMREAVGTSAACGFPIAVSGSIGFIVAGWQVNDLPEWSTGYVYWPAVLMISLISVLAAPLGARLAHSLPQATLKRIFALFLASLGVWMLAS